VQLVTTRILYIGHSPTINTGQGVVSHRLCGALHRAGFRMIALGMGEVRRRPPALPYRLWVPCRHDTMGWHLLPQVLATENPDLAFVHGDLEMTCEAITKLRQIQAGLPIVLYYSVEGEPIHAGWAATIRSVDLAMVYTEYGREVTKQCARRDVPAVPLGIDTDEFGPLHEEERQRWRDVLGWNGRFVLCYVARNMWTKQQPVLLHALRSLVDSGLDDLLLYLHCAPFDRHRHGGWNLGAMASEMGLEAAVSFPSGELERRAANSDQETPGIREIYGSCDLYVHPSSVEGFGFPLLEAMACGCPVLHTADGGVMEEVCGDAGEPVSPAAWVVSAFGSRLHVLDPERLAEAIRRLYDEWKDDPSSWRARQHRSLHRAAVFPWERTESAVIGRLSEFLTR
jgi:glycosyltransferase involved in cell wall biosynthesis